MQLTKIFSVLMILLSLSVAAQADRSEKKQQIRALKVAFLTDELQLTTSEAEKFWPIYNAYETKQTELRQEKMKSFMRRLDEAAIDKLSDKEANAFLDQIEGTEDELYQNRKKFVTQLKNVLPAVKILKLKKAEEDFNRKLLRQYRQKFKK